MVERAAWAGSGAMWLTGWADGPPLMPPGSVPRRLDALVTDIDQAARRNGAAIDVSWGPALTGRAAILGLSRQGRVSANGSCRLLRAQDGWVALNLARSEDLRSIEALVGTPVGDNAWVAIERYAAHSTSSDFAARGRLLGLPASVLERPPKPVLPWRAQRRWPRLAPKHRRLDDLQVVDLSVMWAGPLVAQILGVAGARVTKVEGSERPDGARFSPAVFEWLHPPTQANEVVDFRGSSGRSRLRTLIEQADVVIEASRPRALEQLGVDPGSIVSKPGRVWLSITGYGRDAPGRDWVAFGDDAAVAGGLVAWDPCGEPVFCADAIADPVSGLFGARAVFESLAAGGGHLIDLAMCRCAASIAGPDQENTAQENTAQENTAQENTAQENTAQAHTAPVTGGARRSATGGWELVVGDSVVDVARPERLPAVNASPGW